ncbi:A24 family peptidase [Paraburkholderia sp. RL17-347-BIC-D]|uniref:A24 family peptidase n=1 Tax=Paraburkholderia sp. RL17-347-BIC-D TaxID=3031632 RepID=UPI0038BBAA30
MLVRAFAGLLSLHAADTVHLLSLTIRLVVLCALLWLAVIDVRSRRLPTRVVLAVGALFFVDAATLRLTLDQVIVHLGLALGVFLVCAALFAAKMLGGGDAKLAAVIFLWVGLSLALPALTLISLIGLVVSLISLATRNMNSDQHSLLLRALAMFSGVRGVPYGVALAFGGGLVIVLPAVLPLILKR